MKDDFEFILKLIQLRKQSGNRSIQNTQAETKLNEEWKKTTITEQFQVV